MSSKYNITSKIIDKSVDQDHFCSDDKKIIKFTPEAQPIEISVTREIFNKKFPKFKKVNHSLLKITNIGIYSIATPTISNTICKYILKYTKTKKVTITDALGNVGGMTLMLSHFFDKINVCEIIPLHCKILENNLKVYNLLHKVNIICGDYYDHMLKLRQDVIFLDPPWGGYNYKNTSELSLCINNIDISYIINKLLIHAKYIFLLVPSNFNFDHFFKKILSNSNATINLHSLCDRLDERSKILIVIKFNK